MSRVSAAVLAALALVAAAGASRPAFAQSAPPASADGERLALARQIYRIIGSQTTDAIGTALKTMMAGMSAQGGADNPRTAAMKTALSDSFDKMMPRLIDGAAEIMAQDFTAGQLRDMLAFYQSPTGQALVRKMPEVTQQSLRIGASLVPQMMRDFEADYCGRVTCTPQEQQAFAQLNARLAQTPVPRPAPASP